MLCLDDDVLLHPNTLNDLVAAAEADPRNFMVTGALDVYHAILCTPITCLYAIAAMSGEGKVICVWTVQVILLMCLRQEPAC